MQEADIIPMPGHAIVGMRPMYADMEGAFYIPRNARTAAMMGRVGEVCGITPFVDNALSWVYERDNLMARHAYMHNAEYIALLGKLVVCRQAVLIYGMLYSVRLEHIECVVPEGARVDEDELGRCRRCKAPGGELGVLVGPDGYCPICGRNRYGEHITQEVVDISEYELDQFVRRPAEQAYLQMSGGKALKGNAISYPGQNSRRTPTVSADDVLSDWAKHEKEKL